MFFERWVELASFHKDMATANGSCGLLALRHLPALTSVDLSKTLRAKGGFPDRLPMVRGSLAWEIVIGVIFHA